MKQHNTYNEEALYQQIMAELKPGADEYDRLMAEGEAPAGKVEKNAGKSRVVAMRKKQANIYKYVAAACIAFAIIGAALYMQTSVDVTIQQPVAEVNVPVAVEMDATDRTNAIARIEAEAPAEANGDIVKPSRPEANNAKTDKALENNSADAEQDFLYALITEVEYEALAEQEEEEMLYRSIVEEVTTNMSKETKKPELIL